MARAAKLVYAHIEPYYCGSKASIDATRRRVNSVAWLAKQAWRRSRWCVDTSDLEQMLGRSHPRERGGTITKGMRP